jgi:hypothetical protein
MVDSEAHPMIRRIVGGELGGKTCRHRLERLLRMRSFSSGST